MLRDASSPVVVIGAKGQMGARFVRAFRDAGHPVTEFDNPLDQSALPQAVRALVPDWHKALDQIRLCDTRDKARPCK